jgi:hypothetical protein
MYAGGFAPLRLVLAPTLAWSEGWRAMTAVLHGTLAQHWSFPTAMAWDDRSDPIAATSGAFLMARMSLKRETPPFAWGEEFVKSIPPIQRLSHQDIAGIQLNKSR